MLNGAGEPAGVRLEEAGFPPNERLERERFFALLGPLREYLDRDLVTNVTANEDGRAFVEKLGACKYLTPTRVSEKQRASLSSHLAIPRSTVRWMRCTRACNATCRSTVAAVQAFCPPINRWSLVVCVHAKHVIPPKTYVEMGELSPRHAAYIERSVAEEANIGVAGS